MSAEPLTSDNLHLSGPTIDPVEARRRRSNSEARSTDACEIKFTKQLPVEVTAYVEASISDNTRRAYVADLAHFKDWGGTVPASDTMVARYLAQHAATLSVATLVRRLATISKAHAAKGLVSPTASALVRATMQGIKRSRGMAPAEARPLIRDDLFALLERTGVDLKSIRDRALLLIGFAGGFRRSELVGLDADDIEHVKQGLVVHLRRSKTDQVGAGRKIAIPIGRTRWCPIAALDQWLARSGVETGPLFRPINRHGHMRDQRLSGEAVSIIVKERLQKAGIDPLGFSGHSLRAGFATSAAMAGASNWKIRQQTGHRSDAMLTRYIRDGDAFINNAAGLIL